MATLAKAEIKSLLRVPLQDEVDKLKEMYVKEGNITVCNFFRTDFIEHYHEFLHSSYMPASWWSMSSSPTPNGFVQDLPENKALIEEMWTKAGTAQNSPGLCFRFYRTTDHVETCTCPECELRLVFKHPEFIAYIKELTGEDITEPFAYFTSQYKAGCFLGTHSDRGNGKCAFVLNLTKDWNPAWGGCLHFLEDDWFTLKKGVSPKFNSMTLFHVPEQGIPHFVSPVSEGIKTSRLAFSGWFK